MVTFYLGAEKKKDIDTSSYVVFEENVQSKLVFHDYLFEGRAKGILINLDPYGDREYSKKEVQYLIKLCEYIVKEFDDKDVIEFAVQLKEFCQRALEEGKVLYALGD